MSTRLVIPHLIGLILCFGITLKSTPLFGQCGCDFVISLSAAEWQFDGAQKGVKPGDKICFASGTRTGIAINNVKGTADKPVTITNMCDGKVTINAPSSYGNALEVNGCSYIHFTGAGNPNEDYGIEITGGTMGINFQGLSTNFEVDHLNVHNVGCVGIVAKTDPTCSSTTWRGNFVLRDAIFHDNYIGNTGCEGFYIGNSHYDDKVNKTCNGVNTAIQEHQIIGCQVYNNILENIGNDGIQIGGTIEAVVHHNRVFNVATNQNYGHQNGFQAGGGTTHAVVYNNVIDTGTGFCYYDSGGGGVYFNNIGVDCLQGGFLLQDVPSDWAPTGFVVTNNNFINCKDVGIILFSENPIPSYFANNIIVGPNQSGYAYIKLNDPTRDKYTEANNIKTQDINSVKFVNPSAKDFHLQPTSPAVEGGVDEQLYGVTFDFDENPRPLGTKFDIGAYEAIPNKPTSNAGPDKTIYLPTNTILLNGLGFSSTGITGYKWTQKLGAPATLANETTANVTVSDLIEGVYVFELEVTDATGSAFDDVTVTVLPQAINQSPTANAGTDKTITLPTNTLVLTGSGADPDGSIATYLWVKLTGPTASMNNQNTASLSLSQLVQGVYEFQLTVTDDLGATASDIVKVTVNAAATNNPPTVNAGTDKSIYLPTDQVLLTGTATDSDGSITSILWEKRSGPAVTLLNQTTLSFTADNLVLGTYVFRLTVTDDKGASSFDEVTVQVLQANQSPVAKAGNDKIITLPTNTVVLNGSGTDTDGSIASYQWTKVSGPASSQSNANTANLTVTGMVQGTYVFGLTVTDNNGATGYDEVKVTVNAAPVNTPPTANAGSDKTITLPTNSITLTGTASDPGGSVASTLWSKKSGPAASMANQNTVSLSLTNLVAGVYTFTLTVTDNLGATATDDVIVTVLPNTVNQPPVANAGVNVYVTLPTNSTTLTGVGSDPDGTISTVQWSKVSGPSVTLGGADTYTLTLNNLVAGAYVFKFTVTDNIGATANDQVTVYVSASNVVPTVNAGPDKTLTLPSNSIQITATASDPDGTIQGYAWAQLSGPAATITGLNSATLNLSDLLAGTYEFEITVTDNSAATASDQVRVIVNPQTSNQFPVVSAGADKEIFLPTNSVVITGSATDQDGTIASLVWSKESGPGTFSLANETTSTLTALNLVEGTYVFRLTATDNESGVSFDEVTVTVYNASTNQAPVANGGGNKIVQLPTNTITLAGSGSDSDGSIASYLWEKISGPSVTLQTNNQPSCKLVGLVEGVYVFKFTVTDNIGATASDLVTVNVIPASVNKSPLASAGQNQSIVLPTDNTNLAGSGFDPDGTIQSYSWTKVSGPAGGALSSPSTQLTSITGLVEGVYTYRLTVTDNSNATGFDDVIITVTTSTANKLPVANAGGNQSISLPTNALNLFGSGSDADGSISAYLWTKISGGTVSLTNGSKATATLANLQEGQYVFKLTVTDNNGATDDDFVTITVNAQATNLPPLAFTGGDKIVKLPQNSTTLSGSGSDVDGQVIGFKWTQQSGTPVTLSNTTSSNLTVSNLTEGRFVFRLTVTDNASATAFDEMTLQVIPSSANLPPTVDAGKDSTIYLPQNSITLNGTATDDGAIASYLWTKVSGPAVVLNNPVTETLSLTSLTEGTYILQLTAIDDNGTSASDNITVTVLPATINQSPTVSAGEDQQITLPTNQITLTGTASDADGTIDTSTIKWTKVSGGSATLTDDNTLSVLISNLAEGTYIFKLTVADDQGSISSDNVQVIVKPVPPNQPPLVNAGISQALILPLSEATMTGTTTDSDGTVTSVQWTQVKGPGTATLENATTSTLTAKDLVEGTYIFRLTATDDDGAKGYGDVIIFVSVDPEENKQAPIAFAGDDVIAIVPDQTEVTITGTSLDPDGFVENYNWEQISGNPVSFTFSENILTVTGLQEGEYSFKFTVIDSDTLSASDEMTLTVIEKVNEIPNFFSPNNDGQKDLWTFRNIDSYQQCHLVVFTRSGKEVFNAKPYVNNWDGTFNGKPLGDGDYYYIISCDDGRVMKGAVRIIR